MSDENIANREYTPDAGGPGRTMPGSWVAGNGEMGASLGDDPIFNAGSAGTEGNDADGQGNVTGAGTGQMIDVDDQDAQDAQDIGGGTTGMGVGDYGAGYGGGGESDSGADQYDIERGSIDSLDT